MRMGSMIRDSFVQHKQCTLCDKPNESYFFDCQALKEHCNQAHITCYVCNSQIMFFLDQDSLAEHVAEKHIVCPVCRRNRQVVGFSTVLDLKVHVSNDHPNEKIDFDQFIKVPVIGHMAADDIATLSLETAHLQIDNVLRDRHRHAQQANPPSFLPTRKNQETYQLNFPSIGSSTNFSNVATVNNDVASNFPKYISKGGFVSSNVEYQEVFPGLCGDGSDVSASTSSAQNSNDAQKKKPFGIRIQPTHGGDNPKSTWTIQNNAPKPASLVVKQSTINMTNSTNRQANSLPTVRPTPISTGTRLNAPKYGLNLNDQSSFPVLDSGAKNDNVLLGVRVKTKPQSWFDRKKPL